MIDAHGVEFKKAFEGPFYRDFLRRMITTPDGNIYSLPSTNGCYHCLYGQKMWINSQWLKKLDLKAPATTEEMYTVLKAFKDRDPNGNGKRDEVPLSGAIKGSKTAFPSFFMNAFIYYDDENYFLLKQGKLDFAANKPEWKAGLEYLARLYKEGLIDPAAFTQTDVQLMSLGEKPGDPVLGGAIALWFGVLTRNGGPSGRYKIYTSVSPLSGPNGFRTETYYPYGVETGAYVITSNCKSPLVAFKYADHLYNPEATLRSTYGILGEDWRWGKPGEIGLNNKPAVWLDLKVWGQIQNHHWAQLGPLHRPIDLKQGLVKAPDMFAPEASQTRNTWETETKYDIGIHPDIADVYPPVYMKRDTAAEVAQLKTTINGYVKESTARFITGELNFVSDWAGYVKELEAMDLKRYLDICQKAYDSQYSKDRRGQ